METLTSKKMARGTRGTSTLKYVDVDSIHDGVVRLKSGALRAVMLVSSINFDLKSTDEQDAIIGQYQNFLNSLDFPVQIVVSSRKLNIGPYMDILNEREKQQTNELLRLQTAEYKAFVKNLTEVTNIMAKFFYIVVPFSPIENKQSGFFDKVGTMFNPKARVSERRELFETYKNQLYQRVDHVAAGLSGTGVKLTVLTTDELIELLYNSYNPSVMAKSILKDISSTEIERI